MVLFILLSIAVIIPVGLSILSGAPIRSIRNGGEVSSEQDIWLNERLVRQQPVFFHIDKHQTNKNSNKQSIKNLEVECA